ncbi:MAG TPA: TolC family protein [Kofleriaceae bacterium]|nr:TolC family protein [Kofleriaceae bacterium]
MKPQLLALAAAAAAATAATGCAPSRGAVFGPVDREIERRLGARAAWHEHADPRVPAAVAQLLERPLDRDAAVRIALATSRRLQAQYDALGIAASEIAAATVLPPLEVEAQIKLAGGSVHEVELDVIQDVLDLVLLPRRRAVAQAGLAAARARAVSATIELAARVEGAHTDVVAAQQELELRQTAFDAAAAAADIVERQRAAGNVSELALARERDQREQARLELGRAQVEVEARREALNEALGISGEATRWTVAGRLDELPAAAPALDSLEQGAVAASLALEAIRGDAEAAAGRLGLARVHAWLPQLGVGVSATRHDDAWEAGPALAIGLPLFNQQQGPRARASAELRRAQNEAIATAVELRAQARAVRQRVLGAHAEARHLRDVVLPQRQRIVDETLKQYNAMNASTFELLAARRELVDAGRQYIDALRRFWRASGEARALGRGAMPRGAGATDEPRMQAPATSSEGH